MFAPLRTLCARCERAKRVKTQIKRQVGNTLGIGGIFTQRRPDAERCGAEEQDRVVCS